MVCHEPIGAAKQVIGGDANQVFRVIAGEINAVESNDIRRIVGTENQGQYRFVGGRVDMAAKKRLKFHEQTAPPRPSNRATQKESWELCGRNQIMQHKPCRNIIPCYLT